MVRATFAAGARLALVALVVGCLLVVSNAASNPPNPILAKAVADATARGNHICKLALVKKLRKSDTFMAGVSATLCPTLYTESCSNWYPAVKGESETAKDARAAKIIACRHIYTTLGHTSAQPTGFYSSILLNGFHVAKKDFYKASTFVTLPWESLSAENKEDTWVTMAVLTADARNLVAEGVTTTWDATALIAADRILLVKKVIMSIIGDERIASMLALIQQCGLAEANKLVETPHPASYQAVDPQSVGSTDVTSDFDVTLKSAEFKDTPAVVKCYNKVFLTDVASVVNTHLPAAFPNAILTSATFYDGNAYAEDFLPTDVQRGAEGLVAAKKHLEVIKSVMLDPFRGKGGARVGAQFTLDQLVWGFRHHLTNAVALDQVVVPYKKTPVKPKNAEAGSSYIAPTQLEWLPFGQGPLMVASHKALDTSMLDTRAAQFRTMLHELYKQATSCDETANTVEAAVTAQVQTSIAAEAGILNGKTVTPTEATQVARNVLYVETSWLADESKKAMEKLISLSTSPSTAKANKPTGVALANAVRDYHNLRSLSLAYSPEGGRTLGILWHVLPVLQMNNTDLQLPNELLLVSFVENYENIIHGVVESKLHKGPLLSAAPWVAGSLCKYYLRWADAAMRLDGAESGVWNIDRIVKQRAAAASSRFKGKHGKTQLVLDHTEEAAAESSMQERNAAEAASQEDDEDKVAQSFMELQRLRGGVTGEVDMARWTDETLGLLTPGLTLPSDDDELRTFMCHSGVSETATTCKAAKGKRWDPTKLLGDAESNLPAKLAANADVLKGILGRFAKSGLNLDVARRASVDTSAQDLVRDYLVPNVDSLTEKATQTQMREATQSVVSGALSRMLYGWNCWDSNDALKEGCAASIVDQCSFALDPAVQVSKQSEVRPGKLKLTGTQTIWTALSAATLAALPGHLRTV